MSIAYILPIFLLFLYPWAPHLFRIRAPIRFAKTIYGPDNTRARRKDSRSIDKDKWKKSKREEGEKEAAAAV